MIDDDSGAAADILAGIPELVCPECRGGLRAAGASLACDACGAAFEIRQGVPFLHDRGAAALVEEIATQDRVAGEYEQKRYRDPYSRRYHDWWTDRMLAGLNVAGRVLDNGCGTGLLSERISNDRMVGLDISSEMLRLAAGRGYRNLVLANSMALPFHDRAFDLVVSRSLIHHLPDPKKGVSEIARVLRPGGQAVFADTNTSLLSSLPRKIANRTDHFSHDHANLSRGILENLLADDFDVLKVKYFGYVAYPLIGFPDLVGAFRYFPFKRACYAVLMGLDNLLSWIPLIRTQSWGLIVQAARKL